MNEYFTNIKTLGEAIKTMLNISCGDVLVIKTNKKLSSRMYKKLNDTIRRHVTNDIRVIPFNNRFDFSIIRGRVGGMGGKIL